jgi:hypothetical protein
MEQQDIPKEGTMVETIGALEDWCGDWHLVVGRHRQPKKWAQGDGGSLKKLAAAHRWMTDHAKMAQHKGRSHKALTVEKWDGLTRNATMA